MRAMAGNLKDEEFPKPWFWSPREMMLSVDTDPECNGSAWQENQGGARPTLVCEPFL